MKSQQAQLARLRVGDRVRLRGVFIPPMFLMREYREFVRKSPEELRAMARETFPARRPNWRRRVSRCIDDIRERFALAVAPWLGHDEDWS